MASSPSHDCRGSKDPHCNSPLIDEDSSDRMIGIIVPGGPYSEDAEFRRRTRYAVLTALHVLGYAPKYPQHIGVYIPPLPQASSARKTTAFAANQPQIQFVPYEVMQAGIRYLDYARRRVQFFRVLGFTIIGMMVAGAVYLVFPSHLPATDPATDSIHICVALANAFMTMAVAVYVADITLFSRLFVREAFARHSKPPIWLLSAKQAFAKSRMCMKLDLRDETQDALVATTMTITYVSERTKCLTPFIYFPFIMIALLVISRSPVLGPSGFNACTITVAAVSLLAAFLSAVALRTAAEDARSQTIRNLNMVKWRTLTPESPRNLRERLDLLIQYVSGLHDGAFSPLSQQPVVRALLLPLASYGSTLLLSFLSAAP